MVKTLQDPALQAELAAVYRLYAALASTFNPDTGLGGKLLYAGELHPEGFRLVRAANIAGAASLSATEDPDRQTRAIREGIVDFLVTSLDEALRILKNEIRRSRGVAVGVTLQPKVIEEEMLERGVLPDLLFPDARFEEWTSLGAKAVGTDGFPSKKTLLTIALPSGMVRRTAEFESLLLDSLVEDNFASRQWLKTSPRYLDPRVRQYRSLPCDADAASTLLVRLSEKIEGWAGASEKS